MPLLVQPAEPVSLLTIQQRLRQTADKEFLRLCSARRPVRVYADIALGWAVIVLGLLLASVAPRWLGFPLAFVLVGCSQYGLYIIGHDGLHGLLHPVLQTNDRLSKWFIQSPLLVGFENARRFHLEHHRALGTAEDPDRKLHIVSNKNSGFSFMSFCLGLTTIGATLWRMTPFSKLPETFAKKPAQTKTLDFLQQRVPIALTQLLIICLMIFIDLPFWAYFLLWVAPIYFCVFLADEFRAFSEHAVLKLPDEKGDNERLITFLPSRLEKIALSPHNMNYHAEHHLWVSVPYYNLPKLHELVNRKEEVEVRRSYVGFFFHFLRSIPIRSELTI